MFGFVIELEISAFLLHWLTEFYPTFFKGTNRILEHFGPNLLRKNKNYNLLGFGNATILMQ